MEADEEEQQMMTVISERKVKALKDNQQLAEKVLTLTGGQENASGRRNRVWNVRLNRNGIVIVFSK